MTTPERPLFTVVRGIPLGVDATRELGVLAAVLTARHAAPATMSPPAAAWNAPERRVRSALRASPDGWRASALPR